jgi:hypothetical protein
LIPALAHHQPHRPVIDLGLEEIAFSQPPAVASAPTRFASDGIPNPVSFNGVRDIGGD